MQLFSIFKLETQLVSAETEEIFDSRTGDQ